MQHPEPERAHRHSVLVIEDNEDLRQAFEALAASADLEPVTCADGRAALDKLKNGLRPCLILLDLAMPGMNGIAFRQEQLKDPELADIPVAVVSGTGHACEKQAEILGITRFLRKPIEIGELLELFANHCGALPPASCPPDGGLSISKVS